MSKLKRTLRTASQLYFLLVIFLVAGICGSDWNILSILLSCLGLMSTSAIFLSFTDGGKYIEGVDGNF